MPVAALKDFADIALAYQTIPVWNAAMKAFFAYASIALTIQLGAQGYAILTLARRSANYPYAFIAAGLSAVLTWGVANFVLLPAYGVPVSADPALVGEIVRNAIFLAVWTPYMLVSKRVRATFVN